MRFSHNPSVLAHLSANFQIAVLGDQRIQSYIEEALTDAKAWHQRDRCLAAPFMVWYVIALAVFRALSLPCVLRVLTSSLRTSSLESLKTVTPEALCHGRSRLGSDTMKYVFEKIAGDVNPSPSYRKYRVWGIDGCKFRIPDTVSNVTAFGRPGSSRGECAFPQLQAVTLISTVTHEVKAVEFARCEEPERPLAEKLIEKLDGRQDLVILDRGFAAGWLFQKFEEKNVSFICRVPASWKCKIVRVLRPGDFLVKVKHLRDLPQEQWKGRSRREKAWQTLRLVQYQVGAGKWHQLLTNLCDPVQAPTQEIAHLYHERWECELVFDEIKTHMMAVPHGAQPTALRSKNSAGVTQEAYGLMIAYNLVRRLMAEAGQKHQIPPREISFVQTLRTLQFRLPAVQSAAPARRPALLRQLRDDVAECRLQRSRRPRKSPRRVKIKMSNFQVKKPHHRSSKLAERERATTRIQDR